MTSEENNEPGKGTIQKLGARFQEKWDIDDHSTFEEKWDISKNPKFEDKWDVNKNSGSSSQKKNAVLKEILHDVAAKLVDKWDTHHDEKQRIQKGDGSATKSGTGNDPKNLDNNAAKQETGSVESPSEGAGRDSSSSLQKSGSRPTGHSPYVQAPVPTSQSGLDE